MLKAAPFYLVVLLVAALVTGGMCLTATAKKNVKVDAADVRAVSIKQNEHYMKAI
jgi:archaellum component FlaF (FlaF/FlaG flagellin family)